MVCCCHSREPPQGEVRRIHLPRTPVNRGSHCGGHHSVPLLGAGGAVDRGTTLWMSKRGTLTERMRGTAAPPMNLMWAAGAASWHGSSWSGSRYTSAAAG